MTPEVAHEGLTTGWKYGLVPKKSLIAINGIVTREDMSVNGTV